MFSIRRFPEKDTFLELSRDFNVIPVCAEILADTDTPVSLLRKVYADKGPAFLLESVEGGERWGRYSFLSGSAMAQVRVLADTVTFEKNGTRETIPHGGDPLQVLKELIARFRAPAIAELPRFWGGLVGYLTYEMVTFFEKIPNKLPPERPLAHFMIPDELIIFDNVRHTLTAIVIADLAGAEENGEGAETAHLQAAARLEMLLSRLNACMTDTPAEDTRADFTLNSLIPEADYRERVARTKTYIQEGEIIQSVISQPFACPTAPHPWHLYRAQRFINPSPYLFFFHLDRTVLVGSSPETMVRLENGIATLRPIAGTRPRGATEQADRALADEMLQDEKERAEHLMLVDLGRNDLGRVAETGTVQVTDLMIVERYSHVMHLVSNITCDVMPEYDAWDLLRATFPAGTLSGAPKVRAMEIIAELEARPRGPYGGAVGYISFSGNMDMAITIRTACIQDGELMVRAGAGIVADSDPEREREETVNKARAIERALAMLAGG